VVKGTTFSANFNFGAQLYQEIFQISNPNFSHVLYQLIKRHFESKSTYKWLRYHQKKVEKRVFLAKIDLQMAEISSKEG
jgi:hypothetical protein